MNFLMRSAYIPRQQNFGSVYIAFLKHILSNVVLVPPKVSTFGWKAYLGGLKIYNCGHGTCSCLLFSCSVSIYLATMY